MIDLVSIGGGEYDMFHFTLDGRTYTIMYDLPFGKFCVIGPDKRARHGERQLWVSISSLASQAVLAEWLGPEVAAKLVAKFLL